MGPLCNLLGFLQREGLSELNNGDLLQTILHQIAQPILWHNCHEAYLNGDLSEASSANFAWLLFHLVSFPPSLSESYRSDPNLPTILNSLLDSPRRELREFGYKIKNVLDQNVLTQRLEEDNTQAPPGGRHDNDFPNFRDISIVPTPDEVASKALPFLRPSGALLDPKTESSRTEIHLDNQFRLLREDMMYELREELQLLQTKKRRRANIVEGLEAIDVYIETANNRRTRYGIQLRCNEDLPFFEGVKKQDRFKHAKANFKFLKHQSLACLLLGTEIIAFVTIHRDENLLSKDEPIIVVHLEGKEAMLKALQTLKDWQGLTLLQTETALFAYEFVLKALQQAQGADTVVNALKRNMQVDLQPVLKTKNEIVLDTSQAESLLLGLTRRVSLIQGPPGTGKSFLGALLAKSIHDYTDLSILVVCFTNHALDDILTSLLDIGIPEGSMVRLGSKATSRTEPLALQKQDRGVFRRDRFEWSLIDEYKVKVQDLAGQLRTAYDRFMNTVPSFLDIMSHLEFSAPEFFAAFQTPKSEDGMQVADRNGKAIGDDYLLDRWKSGGNAGVLKNSPSVQGKQHIWSMPPEERMKKYKAWQEALEREQKDALYEIGKSYNEFQDKLDRAWSSRDIKLLQSKRIIGCTTTAAAKYGFTLQAAAPQVVLVEEAGEILESHVLTALSKHTSQLILIGDHKQLRPKVNNYTLTVEKGDGYDLNRSLFERLILADYPHTALSKQHRMRPEISNLIRELTYPELLDAPKTKGRPNIKGLQKNVVFIDHTHPEDNHSQLADKKDMATSSSKQNQYEVDMVLKIVKYLGQQGYGTQDIVVLTPYLGQLHRLRDSLKKDTDPVLNDLDSFELVRAGLMTSAAAKDSKKPLRLATIDNYQGEESKIVIISLTRSNPLNDIGFMYSPERLNVLLSRARDGMIMIGNSSTFKNSRKGKEIWRKVFSMLTSTNSLHTGLPVVCRRHPTCQQLIKKPEEFDEKTPGGGCHAPCGAVLNCGAHKCPNACHNLVDHNTVRCTVLVPVQCRREVGSTPSQEGAGRAEREKTTREEEETEHLAEVAKIDAEIEKGKERRRREQELEDQQNALAQQLAQRAATRVLQFPVGSTLTSAPNVPVSKPLPSAPTSKPLPAILISKSLPTIPTSKKISSVLGKLGNLASSYLRSSTSKTPSPLLAPSPSNAGSPTDAAFVKENPLPVPSKSEWNRQNLKQIDGAVCPHIDKITSMVGLEEVKKQLLAIKSKIDTCNREGTSLSKERFNIAFLGNSGTGKTTVAREYTAFLSYAKVLPGGQLEEISGSRLAYEGIAGAEKLLKGVLGNGGGAIFIDEAYQLTSKHNHGGAQVLDFLLTEMENNAGKLVFILAGYTREMELFFKFNPGLNSRVPYKIKFEDYKDDELMTMLEHLIHSTYQGRMKVEDGVRGLYGRVAINRMGRRRGSKGFGNARELQSFFEKVRERQSLRLSKEFRAGKRPDDFLLVGEDLIGPDPSVAIQKSEAWRKLQKLIGLKSIKESVQNLIDSVKESYDRELIGQKPLDFSLNHVFLGPPGTGKTTVAHLYGHILADLGMLSKGEVMFRNPSDFVDTVFGDSEEKTKVILNNAAGKVLVIEQAHMLYDAGGIHSKSQSNHMAIVVDTIVSEVQNVPGEGRCLLLLGCEKQMDEMFQNVNPGLASMFQLEEAFKFENFTDQELLQIMEKKMSEQDLGATDAAKGVAIECLARARTRPNFSNGGEVENLLSKAKEACLLRRQKIPYNQRPRQIVFESADFDKDFERGANATKNLEKLFEDIVGHTKIKGKMVDYQRIALVSKSKGMDPRDQVPTNFVFTGPPGAGKTTIARKMGQVYFDLGILTSPEVIECSVSDLVGQQVGQTGHKTRALFDKGLGRVVFVDEAYRLAEGHFTQEAIDEVFGLLTHETYKGRIIIILAGYDEEMKHLMQSNTSLSSQFPEWVAFQNIHPKHCLDILIKELKKKNVAAPELFDDQSTTYVEMTSTIEGLAKLPGWGNARDMVQLGEDIMNKALLSGQDPTHSGRPSLPVMISGKDALACAEKMRLIRLNRSLVNPSVHPLPIQEDVPSPPPPPSTSNAAGSMSLSAPPSLPEKARRTRHKQGESSGSGAPNSPIPQTPVAPTSALPGLPEAGGVARDPGVSDAVWVELQSAIRVQAEREQREKASIAEAQRKQARQDSMIRAAENEAQQLAGQIAVVQVVAQKAELEKQHSAAVQKAAGIAKKKEKHAEKFRREQQAAAECKRQEEEAQRKLRATGVCSVDHR
ncbi:CbxX/CfqX family protein [Coprinopsis sp. MPI-PUGE-AT-0042]|nr:CbxX/CfqX family protein [Coprinopsis sp. MPI-PUGE-AT-0042]